MFERFRAQFRSIWKKVVNSGDTEVQRQEVNIEIWNLVYQGKADWLNRTEIGVDGNVHKRVMASLNPMKILAQTMTDYIYSEPPEIQTNDTALKAVLDANNFVVKQSEMIEQQCALGAQAMKVYQKDDKIKIDYITANHIVMISWDNRRVTEAAFLDYEVIDGKNYVRVETHKKHYTQLPDLDDDGNQKVDRYSRPLFIDGPQDGYEITNEVYKITDADVTKEDISGVMPEYDEKTFVPVLEPLFVIIKNPIANNMNTQTPIGLSMGANSLDTFKAIDTAFDSLATAPELCHPMILISDRITRKVVDPDTGKNRSYFDPTDRVFKSAPINEEDKLPVQNMTIPLEVEPIAKAIQVNFDLLCLQTGLSTGTFSFDSATGVVTATQIVSENSKTYRTREKYITAITEGYKDFFVSIQQLLSLKGESAGGNVNIVWDDSIIQDKTADSAYWMSLYNGKVVPQWEMIMNIMGLPEKDAKAKVEEIQAETPKKIDFMEE